MLRDDGDGSLGHLLQIVRCLETTITPDVILRWEIEARVPFLLRTSKRNNENRVYESLNFCEVRYKRAPTVNGAYQVF